MPPHIEIGRRSLALLVALAAAIALLTLDEHGPLAQESPIRRIVVVGSDGRESTGSLAGLAAGQLTVGTPEPQRFATRNLVSLKFRNRQSIAGSRDALVLLADGNFIAARAVDCDDESLTVRWMRFPEWKPLKFPLEGVRGLVFTREENAADDVRLWNRITEHRERHDLVLLGNGDTLTGRFARLDEKSLTLETTAGKSTVDRAGIKALAFDPELTSVDRLKGEGALVSLVDGSRLRVHDLKLGTLDRLECRTLSGVALELPLLAVDSVRFLEGCATYLSDIEPVQYRFEPFFDLQWPLRRDRSVQGGLLRLRGTTYPKGLGVHSRSEVSYRIDGQHRRFQATIGIDDDTQGKGSAVFEVLLDGKSVYKSDHLTGASPPVVLDKIVVTGAKTITLRVDFGELADIQDHADWCDAMLVK